jgi:hypothetical protein
MTPSEKFQKLAAECEFMAKFTHDPQNKPIWRHMAERWLQCAKAAERLNGSAHPPPQRERHRRSSRRWAQ